MISKKSEYQTIQSPLLKPFHELSSREAKDYFEWFIEIIPKRIFYLESMMTISFDKNWKADYTENSLMILGNWLKQTAYYELISPEKIEGHIQSGKYPEWMLESIRNMDKDISEETWGQCFDIGIYFGECIKCKLDDTKWILCKKPKSNVYFNQPILVREGKYAELNPKEIIKNIARRMLRDQKINNGIHEIYKIWIEQFI